MNIKNKVSYKSILFWNLTGSIINALASVILLTAVNRILGIKSGAGDIFSLGFSISQMMYILACYNVRIYQSTDVTGKFSFNDYFIFRMITCALTIAASTVYILFHGYEGWKFGVIFLLCIYRIVEAFSDVFQGVFQLKERLDLAGKSIAIKILAASTFFILSLLLSGDLLISTLWFFIGGLLFFFLYDIPIYLKIAKEYPEERLNLRSFSWRNTKELFIVCFPLFLNGYLLMAIYNEPKLVIGSLTESGLLSVGAQTYYNILFMPAFAMNLLIIFFRPFLTSMAIHWSRKEYKETYKKLGAIYAAILGGMVAALILGYFLGIPVLSAVYGTGSGLSPYRSELMIIIVAGAINSLSTITDQAVTLIRKQHLLLGVYLIALLSAKLLSSRLIPVLALKGAALSFFFSCLIILIFTLLIFFICSQRMIRKDSTP
ncbi:O-antigen/teichoic acid export membrane protein [Aequitasia blattaphilus]|uniref:Lipopolysaccharide biosynthesis protein n=1 Tax=Aequitasia blattaphilus TaxID=2949332 RepID=A0ABT1E6E2_9FIRM|nr:hypothetical protein [Aequitasia blattaphilus]MCP1101328.1 hypothetical protein [Aequitasia blattaphilus]MCR8613968.1 hypothetical protein [Aequitasia blattaphilus]